MNYISRKIFITGGLGYIGSHTVVQLLDSGREVVVLDNLSNSKLAVIKRIEKITGRKIEFTLGDIRDRDCVRQIFAKNTIGAVIHFAGLKAVGQSVEAPIDYYDNNVGGSLVLIQEMQRAGVSRFVFSSSATVYGDPASVPVREDFPLMPTNPYGQSKLAVENILRDLCRSDRRWSVALLRYFNPVGAHVSGLLGEDPNGVPRNLMPCISQVAAGVVDHLVVYGGDYPTADGSGVRDFIHVDDLARGHLAALEFLQSRGGLITTNLGTGRGYSVFEVIRAFERISNRKISYKVLSRRPGDAAQSYSDPSEALKILGWFANFDIERMCADEWRWRSNILQAA